VSHSIPFYLTVNLIVGLASPLVSSKRSRSILSRKWHHHRGIQPAFYWRSTG
jgi:hypothetical protein